MMIFSKNCWIIIGSSFIIINIILRIVFKYVKFCYFNKFIFLRINKGFKIIKFSYNFKYFFNVKIIVS